MSSSTARLDRYKLQSEFTENGVTHRTNESDLDTRRRRIEVVTTWVHERKLGTGAFGEVSLQREKVSGKLRAVKAIAKQLVRTHEMDALIDLQDHRDLFVTFLGWYEGPGMVHIAMEYIAHGDLGQYITDYSVKARSEAQEITSQILEGLVVLHEREICHRDLKPQNILMASVSPLWVKITDFGISKRWAGTALNTHCGTPLYQAPELIGLLPRHMKTGGRMYTWSVDIWALGAVVHEVLTSEIPFLEIDMTSDDSNYEIGLTSDDSTYDTMAKVSSIDGELLLDYCAGRKPFPVESLIMQGVSADAVDFIKSLMVPDPKDRVSAVNALQSVWLSEIASSAVSELDTPGPPQSNFTEPDVEVTPVEGEKSERASSPQPLLQDSIGPHTTTLSNIGLAFSTSLSTDEDFPGPILILLMGPRGAGKSLFASIFSDDRSPGGTASKPKIRTTPITYVGGHAVQLIVGPDSSDAKIDYCSELEKWMDTGDRKINGIIFLNASSPRPNLTTIATQIMSISKLCVPYFSKYMMCWAETSIANARWWEWKESRLTVMWDGGRNSFGWTGTHWTEEPATIVKARCMSIMIEIANRHLLNWQMYTPSGVGLPYADLSWASYSYLQRLEQRADLSQTSFAMPSRMVID